MHLSVCVCVRNCEGVHTPDLIVLVREPDQGSNSLNWLKKNTTQNNISKVSKILTKNVY